METLAIIAYKQPITKGEIEAIRGVNSDYSIQKLLEKELILISGRNEQLPGKPLVYATSKTFMDYFGINTAADLPKIKEVLADQIVEGTIIKPEDFTDANVSASISEAFPTDEAIIDGDVSSLTVNEDGTLMVASEETTYESTDDAEEADLNQEDSADADSENESDSENDSESDSEEGNAGENTTGFHKQPNKNIAGFCIKLFSQLYYTAFTGRNVNARHGCHGNVSAKYKTHGRFCAIINREIHS